MPPGAERVAEYVRRGHTLSEAAELAGVSRSAIVDWNQKADDGVVPYATEWELMIGDAWVRGERRRIARSLRRNGRVATYVVGSHGISPFSGIVWRALMRKCLAEETKSPGIGDAWGRL